MMAQYMVKLVEPCYDKTCFCPMPTTKEQISLISTFVVRCRYSIIPLLAKSKISGPLLVSEAEQAGLSLTWPQILIDRFSCDVAQFISTFLLVLFICILY